MVSKKLRVRALHTFATCSERSAENTILIRNGIRDSGHFDFLVRVPCRLLVDKLAFEFEIPLIFWTEIPLRCL